MDLNDLLESGKHLPQPLQDFHDQKDVFKSLHEWMKPSLEKNKDSLDKMPDWRSGHIYTIDYFLRFMAIHGWTLQRSRTKINFCDLDETIKDRRDREAKIFSQMLQEGFGKSNEKNPDTKPEQDAQMPSM